MEWNEMEWNGYIYNVKIEPVNTWNERINRNNESTVWKKVTCLICLPFIKTHNNFDDKTDLFDIKHDD